MLLRMSAYVYALDALDVYALMPLCPSVRVSQISQICFQVSLLAQPRSWGFPSEGGRGEKSPGNEVVFGKERFP